MSTSELVTLHHLQRKALVYIRQSSPQQLLSNQESLRLQYALRQRGVELGWSESQIEVIDRDLGMSAAAATHREGFKSLLAQVTLGEVGIILSYDVTRLARNCSDWYPLLDLCGFKRCLIADRDGVYDPGSPNGRLLLGLKGQISELELYTMKARLSAGLLNKAERGELAVTLPVGLVRDELGNVHKDPNQEVQERIALVFTMFLQLKSASRVLRWFHQQQLCLPRRNYHKEIIWRSPTIAAIISILKNPAYAGSFVYGRTRIQPTASAPHQRHQKRLDMEEWKIRVPDKYPAYISWENYQQIQSQLMENYSEYKENQTRGVARKGSALLHGLVYCGECGHKLVVQYKKTPRYVCNFLKIQSGVPTCQYISAPNIDRWVVNTFFAAMSAVELDAYTQAIQQQQQTDQSIERAQQQQLERLRYQVALCERQYHRVDPDNRLVAAELERRWESALKELQQAESQEAERCSATVAIDLPPELKSAFTEVGQKLPEIWQTDVLTLVQKKSLLRCLIDKVVVHWINRESVRVRIVWKGGDTTTNNISMPIGSFADLTNSAELERQIVELSRQGLNDQQVAEQLSQSGYRSPMSPTLLPSTVKRIRRQHHILLKPQHSHPPQVSGYLTVTQLATALEVSQHWIYDRIRKGTVAVARHQPTGLYLFPDQPHTLAQFKQLKLGTLQTLQF